MLKRPALGNLLRKVHRSCWHVGRTWDTKIPIPPAIPKTVYLQAPQDTLPNTRVLGHVRVQNPHKGRERRKLRKASLGRRQAFIASRTAAPMPTMVRGGLWSASLTLCLVRSVIGTFIIEKGGLKIALPSDKAREYKDGFDMSLANFGSPKYGGELR